MKIIFFHFSELYINLFVCFCFYLFCGPQINFIESWCRKFYSCLFKRPCIFEELHFFVISINQVHIGRRHTMKYCTFIEINWIFQKEIYVGTFHTNPIMKVDWYAQSIFCRSHGFILCFHIDILESELDYKYKYFNLEPYILIRTTYL